MRTLRFIVRGQNLTKDPACDFSGLEPGTSGYLRAEFAFGSEWNGCAKAASFWRLGTEYAVILRNNACIIPADALTWTSFLVSVTGVGEGKKMTTGKCLIEQRGGRI